MKYPQYTYTRAQLVALKARGAQYLVVCIESGRCSRGTVYGWHKTHEAAARRVGPSQQLTVVDIDDAIADNVAP